MLRRLQDGASSRFYAWRDGLLASSRFQRWAAAFPFTRSTAAAHSRSLFDLCAGFVYSQVLTACVELGLFPILAKGPRSARSLAPELALSVEAAERLLKAATALDLCAVRQGHTPDGEPRYALGMLGAALLGNPGVISMIHHNRLLYDDLADPVALLRGNVHKTDLKNGPAATALSRFWPYATDDASGADAATSPYSALMSASQSLVAEDIIEAYPFRAHRVVMDVGGGDGTFLTRLAAHAPALRLILFDLPSVAAQAQARFSSESLSTRASAVGGDAAAGPLPPGADLITLVRVLHDHDDAKALAILTQARMALEPGGTLLIAEPMAGVKGVEPMGDAYFGFYLLAMGSGRTRTSVELHGLLKKAGFHEISSLRTRRPLMTSAIQARVGIALRTGNKLPQKAAIEDWAGHVQMSTLAVVMEKPEHLALRRLDLLDAADTDVLVNVEWSGISTGTERLLWSGRMPAFPGLGYPLVPGYESVGRIVQAGSRSGRSVGERVFVPGSRGFRDVRGLFGGAAASIIAAGAKVVPLGDSLAEQGVLLALAATAFHALAAPGASPPDLIVGHGVLVRGLWPDFRDQAGPVNVSVAARFYPQAATAATASSSMVPGDPKADILLSGRLFRIRFSGESAPTGCRVGTLTFDVAPAGKF
eukprot:gene17450-23002_t